MLGVYYSGNGNSRYCLKKFVHLLDSSAHCISIEETECINEIKKQDFIVLAYPVYYCNLPKMFRDFLEKNAMLFRHKKVFILATRSHYAGDATGCCARILNKAGAFIAGALYIEMPDCVGDKKSYKKSAKANEAMIAQAENTIVHAVNHMKNGNVFRDGLTFRSFLFGFFGKRIWHLYRTGNYNQKVHIQTKRCNACGHCAKVCPMKNIEVKDGNVYTRGKCTLCYRCVNQCPKKAVTLSGKDVYCQYTMKKRQI